MINQNNIGINTFFGRILPPTLDSAFNFYDKFFGKLDPNKIPEVFYQRFFEESETFVENLKLDEFDSEEIERNNKFKNKNEAKQYFYFIMIHLFKKILESGFTLDQLMNPQNLKMYTTSKIYFNNLIEIMEMCNPKEKEYNHHAYNWIINHEDFDCPLRIIENFNNPSYRINIIDGRHFKEYLQDNKLGVTLSGTLFKTHENELSIFYNFLNELYTLRKKYKKEMYNWPKSSAEYSEFNRMQLTTKIIMNTTYG